MALIFTHLVPYFNTAISLLCGDLEQIRDHFSQPTWGVPRVKVASDLPLSNFIS